MTHSDPPKRPVLLVEDNPVDIDLTQRAFALRNLEHPIQVARDGEEALAWTSRWEAGEMLPQVILLDLKLPRIGGVEVLAQWRTHPVSKAIPVVVLTSSADEKDIQAAYQAGANSYIVKPLDFSHFLHVATQIEQYWCKLNQTPRRQESRT